MFHDKAGLYEFIQYTYYTIISQMSINQILKILFTQRTTRPTAREHD